MGKKYHMNYLHVYTPDDRGSYYISLGNKNVPQNLEVKLYGRAKWNDS